MNSWLLLYLPYAIAIVLLGSLAVFIVHAVKQEENLKRVITRRIQARDLENSCLSRLSLLEGEEPKEGHGAYLAAEAQAVEFCFKEHPDPEFRIIGSASTAIGCLSGEELQLFENRLHDPLKKANKSLSNILEKELIVHSELYTAVSDFVHAVIGRGKPIDRLKEQNNLENFVADLKDCSLALNEGNPGKARKIANKWYRYWRSDRFDNGVLPTASMLLALQSIRAVRSIYGDTIEWIKKEHHLEEITQVKELLDQVVSILKGSASSGKMEVALEFETKLPRKWL